MTSLIHSLTLQSCFLSVFLSIPRQILPSVPISLRLARPLPFTQMTLPPPRSFCLSGSPIPRCPRNHCPFLAVLSLCVSVSLFPCSVSLSLSFHSVPNNVSWLPSRLFDLSFLHTLPLHRCLAWFATAVSPCATTKCCHRLQARGWGWQFGGGGCREY